ncbi:uncharacterized protein LOC128602668 [Ictalurus furcatus]|uniref:uncharacterized protein LOC128602668 n=1 Tax=Ictalurus furcatus TaxID=66913 RepID=UPI00235037F8|nr:uncharacterized protein LOC128602668 [Ictalurus furcatus]
MALQCFVLLVIFLSKCLGHTEFIYTAKDEVKLFCDTNKWQISTESNNNIDVYCTVECVHGEALKLNNIQNSCKNKDSVKVGEKCSLIASGGFYRCVTALDSGFLFPFKLSPNTVTSYIVATANEEMTNKSEERSSVELTEGEDVLLNCSVIFTKENDNKNFVVYWIKTIGKNSTSLILYVTIPILLALAIATVWFIWKKIKTSPGSQAIELQRNQDADDTEEKADMECPYAVGCGEEEIKFRSQGDTLKQEGQEESRDLYSVVKLNDLYEPGV